MAASIRPPKRGNPLYPLPPDYSSLTREGMRQARVNAVCLQETPDDLVWAWVFFRSYYLRMMPKGFFYKRFKESPDFHYQIIRDVGCYPFNAVAAPRASAKSTVLGVELPLLLLLTRPYFNILLILSKDTMVSKRMNTQIGYQLMRNPHIREDFGEVKPPKGQGVWNAHLMQLKSGASIEACSVMGGMLGARPDLILVDDPEIDPVMNKVTGELRENYERLLVNHIIPMLDEGGSSLYWIGTLLSKQCFLYYVVSTSTDERFKYWNRRLLDAEDDGKGNLLWEAKWNRSTLEKDKRRLGVAAYNAQRRNRPGTGDEQVLRLDKDYASYYIEGDDPRMSPFDSQAILRAWVKSPHGIEKKPLLIERPFGKAVAGMFRLLSMDYAKCLSPTSDYIAISVLGIENTREFANTWWHLDLFVGRLTGNDWLKKFWEMGLRWRVQYAGVEAVAAQETLVNTARDYSETVSNVSGWVPRIVPIKYPYGLDKEDRMGSLEWRFRAGKLKLPYNRKDSWPYRELFHEIEGFTGLPGGTQHDDALDGLAMFQFMVKGGRRMIQDSESTTRGYNLIEQLKKGNTELDGGIPTGFGLNASDLTPDAIHAMMRQNMFGDEPDEKEPRRPCIMIRSRD